MLTENERQSNWPALSGDYHAKLLQSTLLSLHIINQNMTAELLLLHKKPFMPNIVDGLRESQDL